MKIDGLPQPVQGTPQTKKKRNTTNTAKTSFSFGASKPSEAAPSSPSSAASPTSALMALQEISEKESSQQDPITYGTLLLDNLREIQLSLLSKDHDPTDLDVLEKKLHHMLSNDIPAALAQDIDFIRQRLAIEIAKRRL